jgi:hypothetical protein
MTQEMYFEKIREFLETKPASQKLMSYLSASAEVGIVVGNNLVCSYFKQTGPAKQDGKPKLEKRAPQKPDVVFHFSPEAIETLLKTPGDDLSDLVVNVVKLYLAGTVKIRIPAALPVLLFRGYVQILKASRKQLLALLKDHGINNLSIVSVIQRLRSEK